MTENNDSRPERCLYCDGEGNSSAGGACGFCDKGVPLDTQEDWNRTWGKVLGYTVDDSPETIARNRREFGMEPPEILGGT